MKQSDIEAFCERHFFLECMVLGVLLAYACPQIGIKGGPLEMQITGNWVAVCFIFFLSGLKLKTTELLKVISAFGQNFYVQFNVFITFPAITYLATTVFRGVIAEPLLEGMTILSCLPSTISMSFVLCSTAGANESISVINAALGNFMGVFVTPALVLFFLKDSAKINLTNVLLKLSVRVFLPIFFGQALRYTFPSTQTLVKQNKRFIKHASSLALVYTVYGSFCQMFYDGVDAKSSDFLVVLGISLLIHCVVGIFGYFTSDLFGWSNFDRAAILFCTTQKTASMGIPLITTMFENDEDLALFQVPLLMYHPLQLIVASFLMSTIINWIQSDPRKNEIEDSEIYIEENTKTSPLIKCNSLNEPLLFVKEVETF